MCLGAGSHYRCRAPVRWRGRGGVHANRGQHGGSSGHRLPDGPQQDDRALDSLRGWLTQNNATVMAVLLLVIGVVLLGKGIGGLTS